jgi:ubiquinone/menaquinone biosynthesis C-methylase UbiE
MGWLIGILAVLIVAALLYWQLIIAEGAYLGRGVVTLLYDWSAKMYDRIKQFQPRYEQWFLARPLSNALFSFPSPWILDVATGTARLPRALFQEVSFRGRVAGLDLSRRMLEQAVAKTRSWSERVPLLWQRASDLPFPDATFEAVTCLEALEFMPDPETVLAEMVRVLRPGGILMTTNRIGRDAKWMPGRTYASEAFEALLRDLGLEMVRTRPWQEDYDLIWAVKPGSLTPLDPRPLEALLRCPLCGSEVHREDDAFHCEASHVIPVADDRIIEVVNVRPQDERR